MIDYLIVVACSTTTALIWRALLLDHPDLLATVEQIPLVGGALRCGFCMALWFSLAGVLVHNPLAEYLSLAPLLELWVGWFTVGAGVLLLRNVIACLLEAAGVLTHLHRSGEKH